MPIAQKQLSQLYSSLKRPPGTINGNAVGSWSCAGLLASGKSISKANIPVLKLRLLMKSPVNSPSGNHCTSSFMAGLACAALL